MCAFYTKWLQDIQDAQRPNGSIPDVAPAYWPFYNDDVVWPSSYTTICHMLYEQYGDLDILKSHYDGMRRWIVYMSGFLQDGAISRNFYGDWCVPPESPELIISQDPSRQTNGEMISTAFFYFDLRLMARAARLLAHEQDAEQFDGQADVVMRRFNQRFLNEQTGQYDNGTQTSCILPLAFGMVPLQCKKRVFDHLVNNIQRKTDNHIGTGVVGGQWLMRVLSDNGNVDLAYRIATQETYPSWGYMIGKGATTIWELWNGDTAAPAMNSGNHVMLIGDLMIWMYEYLAGIRPDPEQPGFKHIVMRPHVIEGLTWVEAHHNSKYGRINSNWRLTGEEFLWDITIPVNTTATVFMPTDSLEVIKEAGRSIQENPDIEIAGSEGHAAVLKIASGNYAFAAQWTVR